MDTYPQPEQPPEVPHTPNHADEVTHNYGLRRRAVIGVASVALVCAAAEAGHAIYDEHHEVPTNAVSIPEAQVPNVLDAPTYNPNSTPTTIEPSPSRSVTVEAPLAIPEIQPAKPKKLIIPEINVNANIQPVKSPVIGKNKWGGTLYGEVTFGVDEDARYWVPGGRPNTVEGSTMQTNPKATLRTIIYGHASDIGNHLLFQDLGKLKLGDTFSLEAGDNTFTYTVYYEASPPKSKLFNDPHIYGLPKDGRKEVALVACKSQTANHNVRIGYLKSVHKTNPSK